MNDRFYPAFLTAILSFFLLFITPRAFAEKILNVYTWSGVIPEFAIRQFEKETGIKVNFSTYDSNEVMYAKLSAGKNPGYDIIEPSSYYIDRMRRQHMLEKLDKSKLPLFKNLNPDLLNKAYDPLSQYSMPFIWGITGIVANKEEIKTSTINRWSDLWDPKYADKVLLLDDSREVFSIALLTLGYSANDTNPEHIKEAYSKLRQLLPNVKLFNNSVISLLIDEDITLGMAWNGDTFKARKENSKLTFIYPKDGFVIWVDNFAIPKDAPHLENAYKFLNFMLRPDIAAAIEMDTSFPTANKAAQRLLPAAVKHDPIIYPSPAILRRGIFQTDIGDEALALYEKYWERLKIGG